MVIPSIKGKGNGAAVAAAEASYTSVMLFFIIVVLLLGDCLSFSTAFRAEPPLTAAADVQRRRHSLAAPVSLIRDHHHYTSKNYRCPNKSISVTKATRPLSLFQINNDAGDTFVTTRLSQRGCSQGLVSHGLAAAGRQRRKHDIIGSLSSSPSYYSSSVPSSSTTTALYMVAKSGGKQIVTTEQFEREVLGIGDIQYDLSNDDNNKESRNLADINIMRDSLNDDEVESSSSQRPTLPSSSTLPILVLFSAPWCGPCRLTIPIVREIQKLYSSSQLAVYEISTDDLPEVAELAGVSSIPTIVLYYGGEVQDTIVGCVNLKVLSRAVEKVMEECGGGAGSGA